MTKTTFAQGQLKALIERIERLEEEKKAIADDIKEVYAEAKANGFDTTIMRKVVAIRKKDADDRAEEEALLDVYLAALGMQPSLFGDDAARTYPAASVHSPEGSGADGGPISVATTETPSAPIEPETLSSVSGADPLAGEGGIIDAVSPASEDFPEMPGFLKRKPTASDYLAAG